MPEKNKKTSVSKASLYTKSNGRKVAGDFFLFAAATVAYSNRSVRAMNAPCSSVHG